MELPSFINDDAAFWFSLVESIFKSKKVTNARDKFNSILLALPHHLQLETKPLLQRFSSVAEDDAAGKDLIYDSLKKKILDVTSVSEDQRLQELLDNAQIGTRTPSQFLNYLRNLQGDAGDTDSKYVRLIFLRNLPKDIKNIIVSQQKEKLDDMAQTADLLWERPGSNRSASQNQQASQIGSLEALSPQVAVQEELIQQIVRLRSTQREENQDIKAAMVKFSEQLEKMQMDFDRTIRSMRSELDLMKSRTYDEVRRDRNFGRDAAVGLKSNGQNPTSWCYFHQRFGASAFKCSAPCTFPTASSGNYNTASR